MCEATAYLVRDGKEEVLLESVDVVEPDNGKLRVVNIFGEQRVVDARITKLSLVDHKIILE